MLQESKVYRSASGFLARLLVVAIPSYPPAMKPIENQTLLDRLQWRYATQKFDPTRKISSEDWKALEQSLILSPSCYGLQPWHFVVITSQAVKDQLVSAAFGQKQLSDASHIVVFAVRKALDHAYVEKYIQSIAQMRQTPLEKLDGFKRSMKRTIEAQDDAATQAWSARQVYVALGQLLTSAAMIGIDACPMEGIEPKKFDEILGLNEKGYATLLITTLGYRAADDRYATVPKVRFSCDELVTRID